MIHRFLSLIFCLIIVHGVFGQNELKGRVYDKKTEEPIAGAVVYLRSNTGRTFGAKSDSSGRFIVLYDISDPAKDFQLTASHKDFLTEHTGFTRPFPDSVVLYCTYLRQGDPQIPVFVFSYNSCQISQNYESAIKLLVETLINNPNITIGIYGTREATELHSISMDRCKAISDSLIKHGIESERLSLIDWSDKTPFVSNRLISEEHSINYGDTITDRFLNNISDTEKRDDLRKLNRRVEFKVTGCEYKKNK